MKFTFKKFLEKKQAFQIKADSSQNKNLPIGIRNKEIPQV